MFNVSFILTVDLNRQYNKFDSVKDYVVDIIVGHNKVIAENEASLRVVLGKVSKKILNYEKNMDEILDVNQKEIREVIHFEKVNPIKVDSNVIVEIEKINCFIFVIDVGNIMVVILVENPNVEDLVHLLLVFLISKQATTKNLKLIKVKKVKVNINITEQVYRKNLKVRIKVDNSENDAIFVNTA